MGAFQACSFWGDPHFQAYFDKTLEIDYGNALNRLKMAQKQHSRGKVKLQKGYNNYKLGLLRLFQTTDKQFEGQAFMCDARGRTTSTAAVAIRRGGKVATFMRPNSTGNQAWGSNLNKDKWFDSSGKPRDFGLELNIQGVEVKWSDLPGVSDEAHSKFQKTEVLDTYVKGSWFAQPLFIHDVKDKDNSFKPMCLGDVDRQIMVKASVPRVNKIYEPVFTIELKEELVQKLEDDGLCMGKAAAERAQDLNYAESLFTVQQLYQLCYVCGMLDGGGTQRKDTNGWESTSEFNGWIHPSKEEKIVTGEQICGGGEAELYVYAKDYCNSIGLDEATVGSGWHDSCLAEYCNAEEDGKHVEGENGALNVVSQLNMIVEETGNVNDELGIDT